MTKTQPATDGNRLINPAAGLVYLPSLLSPEQERLAVENVDASVDQWRHDLSGRTQHYGWRYDYRAKAITPDLWPRPTPGTGCRKSPSQSLKTPCIQRPDYRASTTCPRSASSMNTSVHQASPSTPTTLVSAPRSRPSACWPMHLAPAYRRPNLPVALETGSCLTMTGPSRQVWTHQIKCDQARPRNERRLSLTFRSVLNQDGVND